MLKHKQKYVGLPVLKGLKRKLFPFTGLTLMLVLSTATPVAATSGGFQASGVIGQTNFTDNNSGLGPGSFNAPNATAIDPIHHRLFVADGGNNRVLEYDLSNANKLQSQNANHVLGAANLNTPGTAFDFFSDNLTRNNIVGPDSLAYDPVNNRLFVMDFFRVLVYNLADGITDGMPAAHVVGMANFTDNNPSLDQNHIYYVGEYGGGLAFDPGNDRLFVGDSARVMVFDVSPDIIHDGEAAEHVIGQANYTAQDYTCSRNGMEWSYASESLAFDDTTQRLFVSNSNSDSPSDSCNRIMVYNVAPGVIHDGENAANVLGQPDFTSQAAHTTKNGLDQAAAITYDPLAKSVIVADNNGQRLLFFDVDPSSITNGEDAYAVLGQPDFTSANSGTSQTAWLGGAYNLSNIAFDPTSNAIYYADQNNNRVLVYNLVSSTNAAADGVQLINATQGTNYHTKIPVTGGQGTVSFKVTGGALPPGLVLDSTTGVISGTPTTSGTFKFEITIYDNNGAAGIFIDDPAYSISVSQPAPSTGYGSPSSRFPPVYLLFGGALLLVLVAAIYKIKSKK